MRLAVIVVSYNTASVLRECLAAIIAHSDMAATEIIVVDNASSDGSVAMVRAQFPQVRVLAQTENTGFGAANNAGVAAATAPYIMLLNSDAILLEDTAGGLVRHLEADPSLACAAPRIILPDGTRQPRVFGQLPSLWRIAMQSLALGALFPASRLLEGIDGHARPGVVQHVGWVSGVCMVMRRADFLAAGGFDPAIFMYCEDIDLCARLAPRGAIISYDALPVRHYGGASSPAMASKLRNTVWAQRNLLRIVRARSGPAVAAAARAMLLIGALLRILAGLALAPRRGVRDNLLLRASWLRLRDLAGALPK